MVQAKHVSGNNTFWSTLVAKSLDAKIFEFLHCTVLWSHLLNGTGQLAIQAAFYSACQYGPKKENVGIPLHLDIKLDQHIFFLETCFAYSISEPELTVCFLPMQFLFNQSLYNLITIFFCYFRFFYSGSSLSIKSYSWRDCSTAV